MFIYKIINHNTGKIYVGQTKRPIRKRLQAHFYEARVRKYNMYLHNSIRKHGTSVFSIELIEECDNSEIYDRERYWIKTLDTLQPNGYNEHAGGKGGCLNPSPELREKLRRAKLGKTTWNKGLTKNSDPRVASNSAAISKSRKGMKFSESHKQSLRQSMRDSWKRRKGCLLTEDTPQTSE